MIKLFLLLLFCHVSSAVIHSLRFYLTGSTGIQNLPELVTVAVVDGTLAGYCDSINKTIELKQDWVKDLLHHDPDQHDFYRHQCFVHEPKFFKDMINNLMQRFNQSQGVHILQKMSGCDWDDETGEVTGYMQYGYDGEDLISFDAKTETWIAAKPQAIITKQRWNSDRTRVEHDRIYLTEVLVNWLKKYLDFGKSFLQRKELPSVSLLQKTPSSPVTCHASGFYPEKASLFWRKDGEELHENVDHEEILHNHDGTFQMSVDLNISSVTPADWRRYECVFQLSGVKDDIVTKLDKDVIRTNWEDPRNASVPIIVVALALFVLVALIGFIVHRKKKDKHPSPYLDLESVISEEPKPKTS